MTLASGVFKETPMSDIIETNEERDEWVFSSDAAETNGWEELKYALIAAVTLALVVYWQSGGVVVYTALAAAGGGLLYSAARLPVFLKKVISQIRVSPEGLTIARPQGEEVYSWSELQFASFDSKLHLMRLQRAGQRIEVSLHNFESEVREAIYQVLPRFFDTLVENASPELQAQKEKADAAYAFSLVAAAVCGLSVIGLLAGIFVFQHAFALILSCAFWFGGSCLAVFSIRQKISQITILLSILLVAGAAVWIWQSGFDLAEYLGGLAGGAPATE